jgi:hypothetical protein
MRDFKEIYEITKVYCEEDDRWIYIERDQSGTIVGLNFMQGADLKLFNEQWNFACEGLTPFFENLVHHLFPNFYAGGLSSQLRVINKICWVFIEDRTADRLH